MAASKEDIDRWIEQAKIEGATHIISVCDTFDYSDYPVFIMPGDNLAKKIAKYDGENMQNINEIITIKPEKKGQQGDGHEKGTTTRKKQTLPFNWG